MAEYLDVVGDEIYCGPHKVATFDPSVWSTLRDQVEGLICGVGQSEEVKGLEETIEDLEAEKEQSAEDHTEEVKGLEKTIENMEAEIKQSDEAHAAEVRRLEEEVEAADQRTEDAEAILREIGEDANCFATGRVLLAMQDKLRVLLAMQDKLRVAEQEIEMLRAQLAAKPKKRK